MTMRQRFIDYVRNGSDKPYVSLQIGAGAGFDAKLAGRDWITEGSMQDTIRAYEIVGCDALLNRGLPGLEKVVPELAFTVDRRTEGEDRVLEQWLDTPYGEIRWLFHERIRQGMTPTKYPIKYGDGLDRIFWYTEQFAKAIPYLEELIGPELEPLHPEYPVSFQWALQPFELMGLAMVPDLVMFAMMEPDRYRQLCDMIRDVNVEVCRKVIKAGADFVFLGGPGKEMMSPELYETYMVPDSKVISKAIHDEGGLIYSHICSPIEPFLSKGYYGEMGIDLFETLSPPPVGNVKSLADARLKLPKEMCTRGNIGLDVLLKGTMEDVERETVRVLEDTKGFKHMIAASDYLFYDIPLENVKAIVDTAKNWNS